MHSCVGLSFPASKIKEQVLAAPIHRHDFLRPRRCRRGTTAWEVYLADIPLKYSSMGSKCPCLCALSREQAFEGARRCSREQADAGRRVEHTTAYVSIREGAHRCWPPGRAYDSIRQHTLGSTQMLAPLPQSHYPSPRGWGHTSQTGIAGKSRMHGIKTTID
jgi:hypothetical protein